VAHEWHMTYPNTPTRTNQGPNNRTKIGQTSSDSASIIAVRYYHNAVDTSPRSLLRVVSPHKYHHSAAYGLCILSSSYIEQFF